MRRADPDLHADRRRAILGAALRVFGRIGFHKATMPEIAREAAMSPANLYRYFASRDALIAALVAEDRVAAKAEAGRIAESRDPVAAIIATIAAETRPQDRSEAALSLEILAESLRNPGLGADVAAADCDICATLAAALRAAAADGRLGRGFAPDVAAVLVVALMDGLMWRGGVDPAFDADAVATELRRLLGPYLGPP